MKKLLTTMGALALTFAFATAASAQITGSAHDFSGASWNTALGEICNVCHTTHNPNNPTANAPLWDHAITTTTGYTVYTGYALDATDLGDPTGTSVLCLSCHDGTVAIDSYGGVTGSTFMGAPAAVGLNGDLSDDHPVGFTYNPGTGAGLDAELHPLATVQTAGFLYGTGNNQVECASCHDVHNRGFRALMRVDNAGSDLCLTCHIK